MNLKYFIQTRKTFFLLFLSGFFSGFFFYILFFQKECKSRTELCSQDIKEVFLLREKLKTSETSCASKISSLTESLLTQYEEQCNRKIKRFEEACNDLDCSQCEK